ncbi:MAG: sugar transporter [Muribaculaceae bacterium]|nr:sugar transporter [Muribaculaceae bacterium]
MVAELTSRTKKSAHNSIVAIIYYLIGLILQFFSRKIFLEYLGTEILGLNTTAQNMLQFLNLAELGIGTAVSFTLYKPIHDNDAETVNEIVTLQGHLYKRIGVAVIIGACILMGCFPWIFKKMELPLWYAFASFGTLLLSAVLGYFVNYKQIILSASQKNYKILYSYRSVILVKIVLQMFAVWLLPHGYVWWLILEGLFAILASWSLHRATMKEYPTLKSVDLAYGVLKDKFHGIVTKIKQVFFHKVGGFALTQLAPLIIYAIIDLNEVTLYGNYILISTGIISMMSAVFNSMDASVGNLVAEGDPVKVRNIFKEIFSIRYVMAATLCFAVLMFASPFISVWIGDEYLLPYSTLVLIVINLYVQLTRYTTETFIAAFGLYSDIWSPVVETVLNLGCSIVLGLKFGLNGIIAGVVISQIVVIVLWKPFFLITREMKGFMKTYIMIYIGHLALGFLSGWLCWILLRQFLDGAFNGYFDLFACGTSFSIVYAIILVSLLCVFFKQMRGALIRIWKLISR